MTSPLFALARLARAVVATRPRVFAVALAAGLLAASWWATSRMDRRIRAEFEASAVDAPSVVYAEPVRLQPGLPLSPEELEQALRDLEYTAAPGAPEPGSYERRGTSFEIYLRALQTPERHRPPQRVKLRFRDGGSVIGELSDGYGAELASVETEAPRVGIFYGARRVARNPVRLADVPQVLRDAVLVVEDRRFYEHHGIDPRGVLRALTADVKAGEAVQGGSSISQQLVKNLFLSRERTLYRKVLEAGYALRLDWLYPKDRILEVYLNQIFLGADRSLQICGVAEAARHYFDVDVRRVTLAQAALLAGLIRGPGKYDPFRKPEAAVGRRGAVLDLLLAAGRITPEERDEAGRAPLDLNPGRRASAPVASAYVDALEDQFARAYRSLPLERAGLRIYAPLDLVAQNRVQSALDDGLGDIERRRGYGKGALQGAVIVLDPRSGAVRALVGGRGGVPNTFNRAVQAKRQPGSLMKPFVYAAALASGRFTAASLLLDEPIELPGRDRPWKPRNSDGRFRGPVTLRKSLQNSLNVPSVRLFQEVGPRTAIEVCRRAGISSPLGFDYSIVLGTSEVTALEIAGAFASFAAGGEAFPPRFASRVLDAAGAPVPDPIGGPVRVVPPTVAFLINDMRRGACRHGTAYAVHNLAWKYPLAGKTGTSDGGRDAWFIGYTPNLLVLVWLGPDTAGDIHLMAGDDAMPVWQKVVERMPDCLEAPEPVPPAGLVKVAVDTRTGLLAGRACGGGVEEWFLEGTEPKIPCTHGRLPASPVRAPSPAEEERAQRPRVRPGAPGSPA
ncbi:MAG: transglycosylase domain-containing protein [Deltaproteobacteria bacterium]|nr:transglycosylase domain-containing protein [Deltaproteobacteria bacterium]